MRPRHLTFLALLLCLFLAACGEGDGQRGKPAEQGEKQKEQSAIPRQFGETSRVIDLATQPLAIVSGTMPEAMRRDRTLAAELARLGYELRSHSFKNGEEITQQLRAGQVEVAVLGDMPAIVVAAEGLASPVALLKQNFTSIIAAWHMLPAELAGKKVGYVPGSTGHYVLLSFLNSIGLEEKNLTLVKMPVHEMLAALKEKKIDAFVAWEPTTTIALKTIPTAILIHRSLSTSYLVFHRDFADQHPDAARAILASQARSFRWMDKNPANLLAASAWGQEAATALSGEQPQLTVEEEAKLIRDGILSIVDSPLIPENMLASGSLLEGEFIFLRKYGKIPATASWDDAKSKFNRMLFLSILINPGQNRLDTFDFAP